MRRTSAVLLGVIGLLGAAAVAVSASAAPRATQPFKMSVYAASLSTGEYALKDVSSLDGTGAGISRVTSATPNKFPDIGTSAITIYFRDGVSKENVSWRQDAPNSTGVSQFTGTGTCTGGTGVHKSEKCHYTFTGTYNEKTTWNNLKITGHDTR